MFAVFGWDISVDVLESALKACATSGNLDTRADAFFDIVRAPVTNHVANLARQGPSALDGILRDGLFTVMFLGRVNGYFVMASRGVGINADRSLQFLKNDELGNPNKLVRVVAGSGEGEDGIDSYLRSHPNWDEKDIAIAAKDILQAAIAAAPDEVGPPITVLEVDHNPLSTDPDEINMHWVEPGACKQMPQGRSESMSKKDGEIRSRKFCSSSAASAGITAKRRTRISGRRSGARGSRDAQISMTQG